MANRKIIVPDEMRTIHEKFRYSPGVLVGNVLYIAGQVGRDADLRVVEGAEEQMIQAFENLGKVLSAAGSGFDDVVDLTTYHTDMSTLPLFMEVKNRYFKKEFPTWTVIGVAALAMSGLILEIKATAVLEDR